MAPNKFEKDIQKKFDKRTILPSTDAWDSLSKELDTIAPQATGRNYLWYGIAASFIGLLVISVVYFYTGSSVNTSDVQIVDTNKEDTETNAGLNGEIERKSTEIVVENDKTEQIPTKDVKGEHQQPEFSNQLTSVNEIDSVVDTAKVKIVTSKETKEEMIQTKILEIVATVDSLERNNTALTNAEVDELLRNAQEEILRGKLFDQDGSVDAMALLTEVEDELDKSFRDQIFDSLKAGFLKVRTAVADRNK